MYTRVGPALHPSRVSKQAACGLLIHDLAEDMPGLPMGPFARTKEGMIVAIEQGECLRSHDEGVTWERRPIFSSPRDMAGTECALLSTREGTLIAAWLNMGEKEWTWSDEQHDAPGARLPTYAMRSVDGGETWTDIQKLHDDWTGAIRDIIQTRSGRVVFTSMKLLHNPGRHSVLTYASDDEGVSWHAGNVLDLGGVGHHGGVTESTICELQDGRLYMLLRTNWSQFWFAISRDAGDTWHPMGPAGIEAAPSPGLLLRLSSGRIALFYNRLYPEQEREWPLVGGDGLWSSVPVRNHRSELSLTFSEDECESWSAPVVLARDPEKGWISYPYAFEASPGVIWLTTMQGDLRMRLREDDYTKG